MYDLGGQRTARPCPAVIARQFSLTTTRANVCVRTMQYNKDKVTKDMISNFIKTVLKWKQQ